MEAIVDISKGICKQFIIYPFFSDELKEYGKPVIFSDQVEKLTFVTYGTEKTGMIMPYRKGDNLFKILKRYEEDLKHYVGINATIFSLYDFFNKKKVYQIEFFKSGYWF